MKKTPKKQTSKTWMMKLLGASEVPAADETCGAEGCSGAKKVTGPTRRKMRCTDVLGGEATGDEQFCKDFKKSTEAAAPPKNRSRLEQCDCLTYDKRGLPVTDPKCPSCGGHGYAPHEPAMEDDPRWKVPRPKHDASMRSAEDLPEGWDESSKEKYWESLTGDVVHKRTKCMKEMKDKVKNPGAFCNTMEPRSEKQGAAKKTAREPITTKTIGGKRFNFRGDKIYVDPAKYLNPGHYNPDELSAEEKAKKQKLEQATLQEIAKLTKKEQAAGKQPGKFVQFLKNLVTEPSAAQQKAADANTRPHGAAKETPMQNRIASIRVATPVLRQIARTGQFVYKGWLYVADAEKTQGKEPNRPDDADAAPFVDDTYDSRSSENPPKMDDLEMAKGKKPSKSLPGAEEAAPFVEDHPAEMGSEKPHPVKARFLRRRGISAIR